jgi:hypothetical protein
MRGSKQARARTGTTRALELDGRHTPVTHVALHHTTYTAEPKKLSKDEKKTPAAHAYLVGLGPPHGVPSRAVCRKNTLYGVARQSTRSQRRLSS